jgi:hypothetical protein
MSEIQQGKADHVAIAVAIATVVDTTVVAIAVVVIAVSGSSGSYRCGTDCGPAIRIISSAPSRTTIHAAATGHAAARRA